MRRWCCERRSASTPEVRKSICIEHICENYSAKTAIYTDGSTSPTCAEFSVCILSHGVVIARPCSSLLSSLTTELMAIAQALSWILENDLPQNNYAILSDCVTALQLINRIHFKPMNNQLKRIISLSEQAESLEYTVVFVWVPGHSGIHGNELADAEARRAAANILQGDPILPGSDVKAVIRNHCKLAWDELYTSSRNGAHYRYFARSVFSILPSPSNRLYQRIMFRLRSGHCRLKSHLYKLKCTESPLCTTCRTSETVSHFLLHCPKYSFHRRFLIQSCIDADVQFSINNLLCLPQLSTPVVEYVLSCEKYI